MNEKTLVTKIQLRGSNFHIGPYIIPLYGRKRMLSLIEFLIEQDNPVERHAIRSSIYKPTKDRDLSFRMRDSLDTSLSKLISRSRRFLHQALMDTPWAMSIEWFYFHEESKSWSLCKNVELQLAVDEQVDRVSGELEVKEMQPEDVRVQIVNHQIEVIK